jgi:hypothetical protein
MLIRDFILTPLPIAYNCNALAVANYEKNFFLLYPSPAISSLYFSEIEPLTVVVYDMNGLRYALPFDKDSKSDDVARLSAGVYIVSIQIEDVILN